MLEKRRSRYCFDTPWLYLHCLRLEINLSDADLLGVDLEPLSFFLCRKKGAGFHGLEHPRPAARVGRGACALQSAGPQFKTKFCHLPALQIGASDKLLGLAELCCLVWKMRKQMLMIS